MLIVKTEVTDTQAADRVFDQFAASHIAKSAKSRTDRHLMYEAYFAYCKKVGAEPLRGQALRHRFTRIGIGQFSHGFKLKNVKFVSI